MSSKGNKGNSYFTNTKKGEIHELKNELNSTNRDRIKESVKKVIANMTVGKDVSALFADVIKSMQTTDIELKKLIYLYIINYARSQPEKAILVVNSFQKDAGNPSPLIRALAIRTMGCIRVDRITDYLAEPLQRGLRDSNPYVKKTAALCVAKLYDINAELVEEQGLIEDLRELVGDSNAMVVANSVAALAEIAETAGEDIMLLNAGMLAKLMAALNECTEWGQVFILDTLAKYEPDSKEAQDIIERVSPRLKHSNPAVCLAAVRVIMKYLSHLKNNEFKADVLKTKLPPPLITLVVNHQPEIVFVALRNINLIIQMQPTLLSKLVRNFFVKYNDPIYVKLEKLQILIMLANMDNIDQVLQEFRQYASEADVSFVRKAVRAIGKLAIKLERATQKCIKVLLSLMDPKSTDSSHVLQEAVVVIKDIFRKYPNRYESIISVLCEQLDSLTEPEALASMVWILGEYADGIDNAPELLGMFVESFEEEDSMVQLQLLTATVKLFLKRPNDGKDMVTNVLTLATKTNDNPDLRDRGFVYWRLLAAAPVVAQAVVLAERPPISDQDHTLPASVLDSLVGNLSTLASVFHKSPAHFLKNFKKVSFKKRGYREEESGSEEETSSSDDDDEDDTKEGASQGGNASNQPVGEIFDLSFFGGGGNATPAPAPAASNNEPVPTATSPAASAGSGGDFGVFEVISSAVQEVQAPVATVIREANAGADALKLSTYYERKAGVPTMFLEVQNNGMQPLTKIQLRFDDNALGVTPTQPTLSTPLQPGQTTTLSVVLNPSKPQQDKNNRGLVIAFRTNVVQEIFYSQDPNLPPQIMFEENGALAKGAFLKAWGSIADEDEQNVQLSASKYTNQEDLKTRLSAQNLNFIAGKNNERRGRCLYFSLLFRGEVVLAEVSILNDVVSIAVRSSVALITSLTITGVQTLLTT